MKVVRSMAILLVALAASVQLAHMTAWAQDAANSNVNAAAATNGGGGAASKPVVAGPCGALPSASELQAALTGAPDVNTFGHAGGLFDGQRMWAAVVNRNGDLCAVVASTADETQVWPGSKLIAQAKAYTANAFSLDSLALSTARLYTFTQPGHSLWSLGQANLQLGAKGGDMKGGMIFFGGGVPIYRAGKIIGGLGISGDTSCADHEIAKRTRHILALDPPGGAAVDDIVYAPPDAPSVFAHPMCLNTYRNGLPLGNEAPASYPFAP